jgi:hypothetical protein
MYKVRKNLTINPDLRLDDGKPIWPHEIFNGCTHVDAMLNFVKIARFWASTVRVSPKLTMATGFCWRRGLVVRFGRGNALLE